MRKRLLFWELAGFLWTVAAGTLLHFVYDWSGGNQIAAAFSGVNESTWEHMKLLFFPLFLSLIIFLITRNTIIAKILPAITELITASIQTHLFIILLILQHWRK